MSTSQAVVAERASSAGAFATDSRGLRVVWPLAAVVLTGLIAGMRLVVNRAFYFADDTQYGAFGQWWELGDRLLHGGIPVLDPQAWQAGNYFAEGQWGLLNPLTWVVALGARASEEPVLHSSIVKIAFLMLMAGGVYLLARSFGASAPWAALAAVLVPASGFTSYMDAPSWVTGLFTTAVFPWVWWGLRRIESERNPLAYLVASYLLITFGYVAGVLALVVILIEALVRLGVRREWGAFWRAFAASVWGGLLTVATFLPGVLTAPVTERSGFEVVNDHFLNADLSDLASVGAPTATASINAWFGILNGPVVYIAWIVPFVPLFLPMTRDALRRCIPLFVLGVVALTAIIGPNDVGPIRWPIRFMPYLTLVVVVLIAVMATRAFPERVTRGRVGIAAIVLVATTLLSDFNTPGAWKAVFGVAALQAVALLGLAFLALSPRMARSVRFGAAPRRVVVAVLGAGVLTAGLVVPQMALFPRSPLVVSAVPDSVSRMQQVLADVPGDGIVAGDVYEWDEIEESFDERLVGNLWYLSPEPVSSLYTVLPFSTYAADLCLDLRGATCDETIDVLWETDAETGVTVADLMGVSTIIAMTETFPDEPEPAPGWRVAASGDFAWLLVRDEPVAGAGGVTWTGDGTEVTVLSQSETSVTMRVDEVGADGRVVLSRLPYPGYAVEGAAFADPVRGWLLTVSVDDAAPGDVVTVTFRPPGFALMVAAFALAGVMLLGWPAWHVVRSRRSARARV